MNEVFEVDEVFVWKWQRQPRIKSFIAIWVKWFIRWSG